MEIFSSCLKEEFCCMIVRVSNPNKNHQRERWKNEETFFDIFSISFYYYYQYYFLINKKKKKRKRIYYEEEDKDENDFLLLFLLFFLLVHILSRGGF